MANQSRVIVLSILTRIAVASLGLSASAPTSVTIGMPFQGYWDRFSQSPPATHTVYTRAGVTAGSTQWATDLYAPDGTAVKFYVSDSTTFGRVKGPYNTCKGTAGKYVVISIETQMGATLGIAVYEHLDNVKVKDGQVITDGTTLGSLKRWPKSDCYNVSTDAGVHAHFELGSTTKGSAACWTDRPSGKKLLAGWSIGKVGATGVASKGVCP